MKRTGTGQDRSADEFDVACLRALATDPEGRRLALAAALIKLQALGIARTDPTHRAAALTIVTQAEDLHGRLPSRRSVTDVIRSALPVGQPITGDRIDRLAADIWDHFADGRQA